MNAALLAAEWRKIATTKLLWILLAVGVAYSCVQAVTLTLIAAGALPGVPSSPDLLMDPRYVTTVLGQVSTAATFVLVAGVIGMTGEFRHMTITSTFLMAPRRSPVLVAKAITYALVGIAAALVTFLAVLVAAVAVLAPFDHAPITVDAALSVLAGAAIGMALYGILGICVGSLITNQVAAIVTTLLAVLLVEPLVGVAFPAVSPWLPSGALNAAMNVGLRSEMSGSFAEADLLPVWGGIALLLGYSVVLAAVASGTALRRDIT
jgi:ABC-type transport system involved in multi-copper enzyme maturation permease subunit